MEGWDLLFLIAICAWSGKQLPILNSLSSVIYWVVEANDFRRPITQDNKSLALKCVIQSLAADARAASDERTLSAAFCLAFCFRS